MNGPANDRDHIAQARRPLQHPTPAVDVMLWGTQVTSIGSADVGFDDRRFTASHDTLNQSITCFLISFMEDNLCG